MTEPNSASPTTNPTALATLNTRLRNRYGGTSGSFARRSTITNATGRVMLSTSRTTIGVDHQP